MRDSVARKLLDVCQRISKERHRIDAEEGSVGTYMEPVSRDELLEIIREVADHADNAIAATEKHS